MATREVRDLVKLYKSKLKRDTKRQINLHTKTNSNRISRAFDYVSRAQTSVNTAEKIAFYCTALEALFSTSSSELSHQIAERVAVTTAKDATSRNEKYWFLKKCYDTRSKFLHAKATKEAMKCSN